MSEFGIVEEGAENANTAGRAVDFYGFTPKGTPYVNYHGKLVRARECAREKMRVLLILVASIDCGRKSTACRQARADYRSSGSRQQ